LHVAVLFDQTMSDLKSVID